MTLRTTVRLEEHLLAEAKAAAAKQNKTLTSLIEEGLRLAIATPPPQVRKRRVVLPVSPNLGGPLAGVDISNNAALLDILEGR